MLEPVAIPAAPRPSRSPGAAVLLALLFFGILTLWVEQRWALSALQAGTFLLAIAWVLRRFAPPLRGGFVLVPMAAAVACPVLQLLAHRTVCRFDTLNAALYWATAFCLVFLSLQVFADRQARRRSLRLLLYFAFALVVLSTTQFFTSQGKVFWLFESGYRDRVAGPFVYSNNYAAFIELLLPLAILEALRRPRRAVPFGVMAAAMYASVVASGSRAGSVLATMEIAAVLLIARTRGVASGRNLRKAAAVLLPVALGFIAVVGWDDLWQRFRLHDPYAGRRELLRSTLAMVRERPWLGFGLGTWPAAYPAYALFDPGRGRVVNHAHNDWAEWAAEGGLPFFLLMLSLGAWSVRAAFRTVWGLGVPAVFAHALLDYPMQRLGLAAWVFLMLGALAAESHAPSPSATVRPLTP